MNIHCALCALCFSSPQRIARQYRNRARMPSWWDKASRTNPLIAHIAAASCTHSFSRAALD